MECRIELLKEKKLVGKFTTMSFQNDKTREIWQAFMPVRKAIANASNQDLYSIEIYPPGFFDNFDPAKAFQKWAAMEVAYHNSIPDGMDTIIIPHGYYAVFVHKGPASNGPETYRYIFTEWLPGSTFKLDNRPHFALMGEKYKNDDPNSEEEIWIPVIPKQAPAANK